MSIEIGPERTEFAEAFASFISPPSSVPPAPEALLIRIVVPVRIRLPVTVPPVLGKALNAKTLAALALSNAPLAIMLAALALSNAGPATNNAYPFDLWPTTFA